MSYVFNNYKVSFQPNFNTKEKLSSVFRKIIIELRPDFIKSDTESNVSNINISVKRRNKYVNEILKKVKSIILD